MNVALCAIAKCENLYINEWAEYHLNLGFDHIYVYDNNEIDGEKISDVLSDDRITVLNYRGKHQSSCETQVKAYNECYNGYGRKYDWIMFIDIDEFLTLEKFGNIKDFLSQKCFADAKAVRFHWKCYSDSGKLKYEEGSVISRFTELCENGEVNKYYKQIYRTKLPKFRMMNVHYCDFIGGIYYPDGSSARYIMQTTDQNVNYVCGYIRHYVTKSLEEFVDIKWKRRGNGSSKTRLNKEFYFKYNKKTEEKSRYFDEYFNKVSNGVQPIGNGNTQHNTITQKQLKPKIMPYQQEPPIKSQTQSLGNMDYRTPQERAVCPGARKTANPAIKHGLPQKSVQNDLSVSEYPFGVSVCISAWKTAEYIEDCLDSVAAQTWFKDHDNWEILLGIDGCEETLAKVKEIMHKYKNIKVMMMDKNVGTYVTCNTIMKEARYEWLLRFDSDDVMYPNMVEVLMTFRKPIQPCFVQYQYCDFVGNFQNKRNSSINARGSVFYSKSIFEKYGGYKNWRCAADFEMLERLKNLVSYYAINKPLFYRRKHNNNLTSNADTGMKSEYRTQLHKQIHSPLNENDAIIMCETQTYKKITISPLVSFLIVNRGGTELKKVIDNINNSFNCEKEIIIINQEDTDFFKRGQLFNIGYKYSSGEYLVLMDNDIIILHPFDIVKKYNEINKAYLPFTKVSQLTYKTDTNYIITKTELRPSGFGAFAVVKKNDFIKSNGFSNLCMNWGAEDNIFNIKIGGFYRIDDNIGHITHPSRSTPITEKHRSINYEAYVLYNNKKIKNDYDGYQQTTFDLVYDKIENGVRYLGVKNISVINNYTYKTMLQKHYE